MKFQKNILLKNYTTFKIGGPAKYFFIAKNKKELIEAIKWAKKQNLPFFILGAGSNVLFSDQGYRGLVIKFQNQKLSQLVNKGLEWAAGIPGTVGGAIWGNAGAFGKSMKDVIKSVEVFDVKKEKIIRLNNRECQFGYRTSVFRKNPNLIILSVKLNTESRRRRDEGKDEGKLRRRQASSQKVKEYLAYRKKTQPLNFPSAGSIFKNPKGASAGELGEEDKSSSSATERAKLSEGGKERIFFDFAAARLIDMCGLKGKKIGGAQISKVHSNFIINFNRASSQDVLKLINLVKKKVKNKFGIKLEEEIQILK